MYFFGENFFYVPVLNKDINTVKQGKVQQTQADGF